MPLIIDIDGVRQLAIECRACGNSRVGITLDVLIEEVEALRARLTAIEKATTGLVDWLTWYDSKSADYPHHPPVSDIRRLARAIKGESDAARP